MSLSRICTADGFELTFPRPASHMTLLRECIRVSRVPMTVRSALNRATAGAAVAVAAARPTAEVGTATTHVGHRPADAEATRTAADTMRTLRTTGDDRPVAIVTVARSAHHADATTRAPLARAATTERNVCRPPLARATEATSTARRATKKSSPLGTTDPISTPPSPPPAIHVKSQTLKLACCKITASAAPRVRYFTVPSRSCPRIKLF